LQSAQPRLSVFIPKARNVLGQGVGQQGKERVGVRVIVREAKWRAEGMQKRKRYGGRRDGAMRLMTLCRHAD